MAQYEDFTIDQGADFAVELHLVDKDNLAKDLIGHTVSGKLKKTYTSDSADTVDFSTVIATPTTSGVATFSLTNLQTDALEARRYVYDFELSHLDSDSNTIIERILEGKIEVKPSVTR